MMRSALFRGLRAQPLLRGPGCVPISGTVCAGSSVHGRCLSSLTSAFPSKGYIGGHWVDAVGGNTFDVQNPATLEVLATLPEMGAQDVQHAIDAAESAFPAWRRTLAKERSAAMRRWFNLITSHTEEIAQLITAECGKPLAEARGEVAYAASFIEWFAEEAKRMYGDVIPETMPGRKLLTIKQPVGVCALMAPWNFPAAMIARKAGPALAAGCTTVIKPSGDTPLTTLYLCKLAEEAGIPNGVLNVITCSDETVSEVSDTLCESPVVRKLSFTGSTAVGQHLMAKSAKTVKRLSLELGGNAPFIVFDDADIDRAVTGIMASKYRNSGQTCVCANRIFVQDGVFDEFAEKFAKAVADLKLGNGAHDGVHLGPLIHSKALAKMESLVDDALGQGATVLTGGGRPDLGPSLPGHFYSPTVLVDVLPSMEVTSEEIFGPVAPLQRFSDVDEVIARANDSTVGLAGYFFSKDLARVWHVATELEVGMVAVNEGILSTEVAPFGGVKLSGLGREGGHEGLNEYTETKYICMGGL